MTSVSTLPEDAIRTDGAQSGPPHVPMLALVWSNDEPRRVGELLTLPPGSPGPQRVFGRGNASSDDPHPRVMLARHRPGLVTPCPEITSARISRVQLRLRSVDAGGIDVENAGKCRLFCNGQPVERARVGPGDTIELGGQLVFVCVVRPAWLIGQTPGAPFPFGRADAHGIVGESAAAWALRQHVAFVAARSGHALVRGESGTGKELVARAIHAGSPRAARPLCARNAATFPEALVDAELFGNIRNYPNPGMVERPGLVGEADGSTLFLDELPELPVNLQAHLLRVLDAGEYHRLGDARARRADVRLIGATNRPESALKHDLLARLVFRVETPGLNERREDIPLLAEELLLRMTRDDREVRDRFFDGSGAAATPRLSPALIRALVRRNYTAHVRELEGLLWRSIAMSSGDRLDPTPEMGPAGNAVEPGSSMSAPKNTNSALPDEGDRSSSPPVLADGGGPTPAALQAALDAHNGSIEDAYRSLGLSSRHVLTRLIRKHGIEIRKRQGG